MLKAITSFYLTTIETIFKQTIQNKPVCLTNKERGLTKSEFVDVINDIFGE